MADRASFRIVGRVIDASTRDGIPDLLIKAWDADLIFDDLVGSAPTDTNGSFFMEFDESYFKELFFDRRPDLYFEIFHRGRYIFTTKGDVQWQVGKGETEITIELDRELLGDGDKPDRPVYPDPRQDPDLPPDDPVSTGGNIPPPPPGNWKGDIATWWADRKQKRKDDGTLHEPKRPIPKPFLDCTSHFGPQISALALNQPGQVSFTVWNDGNAPAWTCYAELYEGPGGYSHPLGPRLRLQDVGGNHPRRHRRQPWTGARRGVH